MTEGKTGTRCKGEEGDKDEDEDEDEDELDKQ